MPIYKKSYINNEINIHKFFVHKSKMKMLLRNRKPMIQCDERNNFWQIIIVPVNQVKLSHRKARNMRRNFITTKIANFVIRSKIPLPTGEEMLSQSFAETKPQTIYQSFKIHITGSKLVTEMEGRRRRLTENFANF